MAEMGTGALAVVAHLQFLMCKPFFHDTALMSLSLPLLYVSRLLSPCSADGAKRSRDLNAHLNGYVEDPVEYSTKMSLFCDHTGELWRDIMRLW